MSNFGATRGSITTNDDNPTWATVNNHGRIKRYNKITRASWLRVSRLSVMANTVTRPDGLTNGVFPDNLFTCWFYSPIFYNQQQERLRKILAPRTKRAKA